MLDNPFSTTLWTLSLALAIVQIYRNFRALHDYGDLLRENLVSLVIVCAALLIDKWVLVP